MVLQALRATRDHKDLSGFLERLAVLVLWVTQAHPVTPDSPDPMVYKDLRVNKDLQDPVVLQAQPAHLAHLETRVLTEPWVRQVFKELKDPQDQMVLRDHQDLPGHRDNKEAPDLRELQGLWVL